jgi:hypothetical protein
LGKTLHEYVARYLEKKFSELREWDSYDPTTDPVTASHGVRNKLKRLLASAQSFEGLANCLSRSPERDLLEKLNFLMACAMTPPIFPLTPQDEPRVDDAFIEQCDVYDAFLKKNFTSSEERASVSFITLNYDCLLERAICRTFYRGPLSEESRCLCNHVDYSFGSQPTQGIKVLKPHGSINWLGDLAGLRSDIGNDPITVSFDCNNRPSYKHVKIVPTPIEQEPEELVIAHYAPGKQAQANPDLLHKIQDLANARVREADFIEIIGVHLPPDSGDDPFLWNLLELMQREVRATRRVIYVNPDSNDAKEARDYYHFETIQKPFQEYVGMHEADRKASAL